MRKVLDGILLPDGVSHRWLHMEFFLESGSVYKGTSIGVIGLVNQRVLLFLTIWCLSASLQMLLLQASTIFQ